MIHRRIPVPARLRLQALLICTAVIAGLLGWSVHWRQMRREFVAEHQANYASRGGDPRHFPVASGTTRAPIPLWVLGETGCAVLQFDVPVASFTPDRPFGSYPEIQQAVLRARRLFPEVMAIDVEPTTSEAQ